MVCCHGDSLFPIIPIYRYFRKSVGFFYLTSENKTIFVSVPALLLVKNVALEIINSKLNEYRIQNIRSVSIG